MNADYEEIKRSQFKFYLDVTPKAETRDWKLFGFGMTSLGIEYNNQITAQKWVIDDNATFIHESNQKQSDSTMRAYKNLPTYEFLAGLRDKTGADVKGHFLEVDSWNDVGTSGSPKYKAKMSNVITPISSELGENAEIGVAIRFNGDPVEGYVTIGSSGEITFSTT